MRWRRCKSVSLDSFVVLVTKRNWMPLIERSLENIYERRYSVKASHNFDVGSFLCKSSIVVVMGTLWQRIIYFCNASMAFGVGSSSTWIVPLKSISTALMVVLFVILSIKYFNIERSVPIELNIYLCFCDGNYLNVRNAWRTMYIWNGISSTQHHTRQTKLLNCLRFTYTSYDVHAYQLRKL